MQRDCFKKSHTTEVKYDQPTNYLKKKSYLLCTGLHLE